MFTPERLDAVLNSDFSLGCLPKRTLFPDNNQVPCEDEDSGLGMEEVGDFFIIPSKKFLNNN